MAKCMLYIVFFLFGLQNFPGMVWPGYPYWRGRLSTVDLLVLTSLDQLNFKLEIWFTFVTKHTTLLRRPAVLSCTEPSSSVSFLWLGQYNRPLSICSMKKLMFLVATKSWWSWRECLTDCWWSIRDFRPAAQASPYPLITYSYYID